MYKAAEATQWDDLEDAPFNSASLRKRMPNDAALGSKSEVKTNKALFIAAIRHNGELVTRISAKTPVERMALAPLLRSALSHLEAEVTARTPLTTLHD